MLHASLNCWGPHANPIRALLVVSAFAHVSEASIPMAACRMASRARSLPYSAEVRRAIVSSSNFLAAAKAFVQSQFVVTALSGL